MGHDVTTVQGMHEATMRRVVVLLPVGVFFFCFSQGGQAELSLKHDLSLLHLGNSVDGRTPALNPELMIPRVPPTKVIILHHDFISWWRFRDFAIPPNCPSCSVAMCHPKSRPVAGRRNSAPREAFKVLGVCPQAGAPKRSVLQGAETGPAQRPPRFCHLLWGVGVPFKLNQPPQKKGDAFL